MVRIVKVFKEKACNSLEYRGKVEEMEFADSQTQRNLMKDIYDEIKATYDAESTALINLELRNLALDDCRFELSDRDDEEYGKEECTNLNIAAAAVICAYKGKLEQFKELAKLTPNRIQEIQFQELAMVMREKIQWISQSYPDHKTQADAGQAFYDEVLTEHITAYAE